ncbi:hypothetical protein ACERII_16625 [Evansella sp. AB-rgal1]|uniref:hypothetical protein n=1 Tax=Evansella sp. AB-rgal1 TaxID=3242696 RepID=UPI00359DB4DC
MNQQKVIDAQVLFLDNYLQLLKEVEKTIHFVLECYRNNDSDIGERLLKEVLSGLTSYNEENMTLVSIFGTDEITMKRLRNISSAIHEGVSTESFENEQARMKFINENIHPALIKWKQVLITKRNELSK